MSVPAMPQVGFIGCGRMGLPMARRLLRAGFPVHACDPNQEALDAAVAAGARPASAPATAASRANVVITMLPAPQVVASVAGGRTGLLAGLRRGALWLEMTSSAPEVTAELDDQARRVGAALLDAPVTGGVRGAEEGTLTIIAGGDASLVERARPLLEVLGDTVIHVGDRPGDGDIAKTMNNMVSATNLTAVSEALALGTRTGLDPEKLLASINSGTGASQASCVKVVEHVLTGRFDAGFTIAEYLKDLRIAAAVADRHRVDTPVNACARALWTSYVERGDGELDHTRVAELVARDAPDGARVSYAHSQGGPTLSQDDAQNYLDDMVRARGYVLEYHKLLVGADLDFAKAMNAIVSAAYLQERRLDRRTKELCFITSLVALRAPKKHIQGHIHVALELGLTKEEILEAIEMVVPEAGVVAFQEGFEAWAEAVGAEPLQPRVTVAGNREP
jgi:3-hydroxyisobutyrate dehydrogenase-like beta-hydroxyacid dehydrogenase/alkylhydroperoxidase/carboxymuconolactone decarboxylase family protein YurZ